MEELEKCNFINESLRLENETTKKEINQIRCFLQKCRCGINEKYLDLNIKTNNLYEID